MRSRPDQEAELATGMAALELTLETGGTQLIPDSASRTRAAIDRTRQRVGLGAEQTVVALVGATGSGKSSLFNALAGMNIAEVGARRPTTSLPMACIWGDAPAGALLDWLDVPPARRTRRESVLDADQQAALHGLVLLDLPDHDSTEVAHRVEVERLVQLVDLLVWVVDPQKYADEALHAYLRRLTGHDGIMVLVLNQVDRLTPDEADDCARDLRRLLAGDRLPSVRMLALSATRGDGVEELRSLLAAAVQDRTAMVDRAAADLQAAATDLATGLAATEPADGEPPGSTDLVDALSAAAGVPAVLDSVAAEYRRRGWRRAGWPVLRWLRRLTPDAVGRLGGRMAEDDLRLIATSLIPRSVPSQQSRVELAVDAVTSAAADPLPARWATAVRDAVATPGKDMVATLDLAVAGVDLELAPPAWWRLAAGAQFVCSLALAVGAAWLVVVGAAQIAGRPLAAPPHVLGIPLPLGLVASGLVVGLLLAIVVAGTLRVRAGHRRAIAAMRMEQAVRRVAEEWVLAPVRDVLQRHRRTREALAGVNLSGPEPAFTRRPGVGSEDLVVVLPADPSPERAAAQTSASLV